MAAGIYAANCYIVYSENTKDGIIVDPGGDSDEILDVINERDINIDYIILTHGHGDHIGGVISLINKLKVPLLIHEEDVDMISDANMNLSNIMPSGPVELKPDRLLKDGDIIKFGDLEAEIIHTPGHTKGGISIKIGDNLITGDTLFQGSIGRTDLIGGDYDTIISSIKEKLLIFPDYTIVWPGHGAESTVGSEKRNNPFLR
ncbi:MAG: MBL fold metallo-hydrolase [Tissierellia bacterium]|jgi:glyoxylase-like metal-dependent hydrolase (beta-lactamase superfamily II)|nr:MBL fold metallo-hydrolase [Tissierellia bacterium]